jgi:hypothetical protein
MRARLWDNWTCCICNVVLLHSHHDLSTALELLICCFVVVSAYYFCIFVDCTSHIHSTPQERCSHTHTYLMVLPVAVAVPALQCSSQAQKQSLTRTLLTRQA